MWRRFVEKWTRVRERRRLLKRVRRALKLRPRGAIANDGLPLKRLSTRLEVVWSARGVQPWDRDLPVDRQTKLFVEQCLNDTIVALPRMFARMAEVDVIDIRVVEPERPEKTVLVGTVLRDEVDGVGGHQSPRMSLKMLGVRYRIGDAGFESVSSGSQVGE
jgi:hypothetical protein